MGPDRESLYVTIGELAWLSRTVGLELPVEAQPLWSALAPHHQVTLIEVGEASAAARGMASDGEVVPAIAEALQALADPWLIAHAAIDLAGIEISRRYVAGGDLGIEIEPVSPLVIRIGVYSPFDLYGHIVAFVDPGSGVESDGEAFTIGIEVLEGAMATADEDEAAAEDALASGGLDPERARWLASGLRSHRTGGAVAAHHRTDDDSMMSGHITWIDLGDRGLWSGSVDGETVTMGPVSRAGLLAAVSDLLPVELRV